MRLKLEKIFTLPFVVLMSVASGVVSVDIYVPSMPNMTQMLSTSQEMVQFTITISTLGFALAALFLGPISDSYGRRRVFVLLQSFYLLATIGAAMAPNIEWLLVARFFQGIGSAGAMVLGFAVIADVYHGTKRILYFSYISMTITMALVLAPIVGGFIAAHYDWQMSFWLLAVLGFLSTLMVWLFLPETKTQRNRFSLSASLSTYKKMFTNSRFVIMAIIPSLMIGGIIGFVTNASFYFIEVLQVSPGLYGIYQAITMIFNSLGSLCASRMVQLTSARRTLNIGISLMMGGAVGFVVICLAGIATPVLIIMVISVFSAGLGGVFAIVTAKNMDFYPDATGASSAIISLIRSLTIAGSITIAGITYAGNVMDIAVYVAGISLICLVLYGFVSSAFSSEKQSQHHSMS